MTKLTAYLQSVEQVLGPEESVAIDEFAKFEVRRSQLLGS